MSVRCAVESEPRKQPSQLGQEDELRHNGQHQHHRGEDSPLDGQHHHKEGTVQICRWRLLHHERQEDHITGQPNLCQWEDQDLPRGCLVQQGHDDHFISESLEVLSQTQNPLDERGSRQRVGGLAVISTTQKDKTEQHHREHTDAMTTSAEGLSKLTSKTGLHLFQELLIF